MEQESVFVGDFEIFLIHYFFGKINKEFEIVVYFFFFSLECQAALNITRLLFSPTTGKYSRVSIVC